MAKWEKQFERGQRELKNGRSAKAARYLREAAALAEVEESSLTVGTLFLRLASAETSCDQDEAASVALKKAVEIAEQHLDEPGGYELLTDAVTALAWMTAEQSDEDSAIEMLSALLERVEPLSKPAPTIELLQLLGVIYEMKESYYKAKQSFLKAYELQKQFDTNDDRLWELLKQIREICLLREEFAEAERFDELHSQALIEDARATNNPRALELVDQHEQLRNALKKTKGEALMLEAVRAATTSLSKNKAPQLW